MSEGRTYEWMHRHLPNGRWNLDVPEVLDQLAKAGVETADFLLIPHRQKSKLNGQMSDGIANSHRPDRASISIHPEDAAILGLREGGRARVSTATGMLEAPVGLDSRYRRGVVSVPHGFGHINVMY